MEKPEDLSQEVWDKSLSLSRDYLDWVEECWPKSNLPRYRLLARLTNDLAKTIMAAQVEAVSAMADEIYSLNGQLEAALYEHGMD